MENSDEKKGNVVKVNGLSLTGKRVLKKIAPALEFAGVSAQHLRYFRSKSWNSIGQNDGEYEDVNAINYLAQELDNKTIQELSATDKRYFAQLGKDIVQRRIYLDPHEASWLVKEQNRIRARFGKEPHKDVQARYDYIDRLLNPQGDNNLLIPGSTRAKAVEDVVYAPHRERIRQINLGTRLGAIAIIGVIGAGIFFSFDLTGNVISMNTTTSNILGFVFLVVALVGGFFWWRSKRKLNYIDEKPVVKRKLKKKSRK